MNPFGIQNIIAQQILSQKYAKLTSVLSLKLHTAVNGLIRTHQMDKSAQKSLWKPLRTALFGTALCAAATFSWGQAAKAANAPAPAALQSVDRLMNKLTDELLKDPRNPQLLLQRGILLSEMEKFHEAFVIFDELRIAYPDQPAPYLNLASINAHWGKLEEARQMLMKADSLQSNRFQTQVSLSAVHIGLAREALAKAREINPGDVATQTKLAALERYIAENNPATKWSTSKTPVVVLAPPPVIRAAEAAPVVVSSAKTPVVVAPAPTHASVLKLDVSEESGTSDTGSRRTAAAANSDDTKTDVFAAIVAWSQDWSAQSYEGYISHYSSDFRPSDGTPRATWEQRKRDIFNYAKFIKVDVRVRSAKVDGALATVIIEQTYRSNIYKARMLKELKLRMEQGEWKLLSERLLSKPTPE
jgi:Flp pilus assembly protein TadD